ncbi:plant virulence effector HPE1-like domain-containing protein [Rhizobium arsenicireducens]
MRKLILTAALLFATGPALASSIEVVGSARAIGSSIFVISCTDCPALKAENDEKSYNVPQIAPGTQSAEIVEVDGERRLKRAEAWLGGSPVVFISKADGWTTNGSVIAAASVGPADGIDVEATTAAVPETTTLAPVAASLTDPAAAKSLDVTTFELRVD